MLSVLENALPVVPSAWGDHSGWRPLMSTQGQGLGPRPGQGIEKEKLGSGIITRPSEGTTGSVVIEEGGSATIVGGVTRIDLGSGKMTTAVAAEEEDDDEL